MQAAGYHLHQPVGLEDDNLIIHISLQTEHIQIGKTISRGSTALALLFFYQDRSGTCIHPGSLKQV